MSIPVFATPTDLQAYTGQTYDDADLLLQRASEAIYLLVTIPIADDVSNVNIDQKEALKYATLAQAVYMDSYGGGLDTAIGVAGSVSIGNFSFSAGSGGNGAVSQYSSTAVRWLMKDGLLQTKGRLC